MRFASLLRSLLLPANVNQAGAGLQDLWQEQEFTPGEIENCCEVIDNHSKTTLVCFSGLALGFAGLPSFEFRKSLGAAGERFNLLFVRDIRRFWYHLNPSGTADGLDFFSDQIRELQGQLAARRMITVGVSAGGYAALYFGLCLGADGILAFSPQTHLAGCARLDWQVLLAGGAPLRQPRTWLREQLSVALVLRRRLRLLESKISAVATLQSAQARNPNASTRIHLYYCRHNGLDAAQARAASALAGIHLHGCDCDAHNVAGYLREEKVLFERMMADIEEITRAPGI